LALADQAAREQPSKRGFGNVDRNRSRRPESASFRSDPGFDRANSEQARLSPSHHSSIESAR